MPHIYITDEAKKRLDKLVKLEKRTISKEVEFLIQERHQSLSASKLQDTTSASTVQRN